MIPLSLGVKASQRQFIATMAEAFCKYPRYQREM
jgi:hypothetical protein